MCCGPGGPGSEREKARELGVSLMAALTLQRSPRQCCFPMKLEVAFFHKLCIVGACLFLSLDLLRSPFPLPVGPDNCRGGKIIL